MNEKRFVNTKNIQKITKDNRQKAIEQGSVKFEGYFPCKRCGNTIRYVRNNSCVYCHKNYHKGPTQNSTIKKDSWLKRKYNISLKTYNLLLEQQQGVCKICSQSCPTGKSLAVDHDHQTGEVRGLLCKNCNIGLGMFFDNLDRLESAVLYLKKHNL